MPSLGKMFKTHPTETWLMIFITSLSLVLSITTDQYFSLVNLFDLLNISAVNIIFAVGLLVVLISGGIDISFAVAASVVQYVAFYILNDMGGGNWFLGFVVTALLGIVLGAINAGLIHYFRIISIVVTIATFNIFFGLLMFLTKGVYIYNLPDWWTDRVILIEHQMANGTWAELTLPVAVMVAAVVLTWGLINYTSNGRQIYAYGDNPEGARRVGVNVAAVHFISYGWLGMMAGIGGLIQAHFTQEIVPNALIGRELDVLAAVVLGGATLGGGSGTVLGCVLGVLLMAIIQNGLNLLGVTPFAFKAIVGVIILFAITLSNVSFTEIRARMAKED